MRIVSPGAFAYGAGVVGRTWLILTIAAAVFATAGCSNAPSYKPTGRIEVPAKTEEGRATVAVKLGMEVVLHLPVIAKSGDAWTIVLHDARFLKQLRPITPTPDGGATVSFLAIRQGRRMLRFLALPPGSREAQPSQSYDIILAIE